MNRPHVGTGTILLATVMLIVAMGAGGCADPNGIKPDDGPKDILGVMQSMKTDLGALSETYPELSDADKIKIIIASDKSSHTVAYTKNCTFRGKMGYEDTGANACAVALRVMTGKQYQKDVREVAMTMPAYTWKNLKLVGWTTLHTGKKPSEGFEAGMKKIISKHVAMINKLDAQAAPE